MFAIISKLTGCDALSRKARKCGVRWLIIVLVVVFSGCSGATKETVSITTYNDLQERYNEVTNERDELLHSTTDTKIPFASIGEVNATTDGIVIDTQLSIDFSFGKREGYYSGEIISNLPNGYGIFKSINEIGDSWTYIGEWDNGHFNGYGITKWDDTVHIGEYENDKMTGYGRQFFSDNYFDGIFRESIPYHGKVYKLDGTLAYEGYINTEKFLTDSFLLNEENSTNESTRQDESMLNIQEIEFSAGQYVVGRDIPSGEYKLIPEADGSSIYYKISSDALGKDIIASDYIVGTFAYIVLEEGQYIKIQSCTMQKVD